MNPARQLIHWYEANGRDLPWRRTKDPYKVWLSEIMLQQTRVDQGLGYYLRFTERFPTVQDLADAEHDEVMKYWEGLGYYSRARSLHHTAKVIAHERGGRFPEHWSELIKLKGIGPYTSRAIGSICFGNKAAVVDGNVFRVLSRLRADFSPIDLPETRRNFQAILDGWVQEVDAAQFNQGIMDLGAMVCTPKKPQCAFCPVSAHCKAHAEGVVMQLPVKAKKTKRKTQYLNFFLVGEGDGELLVRRRPMKGIWAGLWEIPSVEVTEKEWKRADLPDQELLGAFKHVLTHIDMMIKVFRGSAFPGSDREGLERISLKEVDKYAFSRAVLKIFERYLSVID